MQIHLANSTLSAQIDDADLALVSPYIWFLAKKRNKLYATARVNGHRVFMHRHLMGKAVYRWQDETPERAAKYKDTGWFGIAESYYAENKQHD
jgi:hypothetical protein